MKKKILIVEDEEKLASLLEDYLQQANFLTKIFYDGVNVVEYIKNNDIDLVILDLMLPGKDGVEICKEIRQFSQIPIIMTTAKVEQVDRLLGLELGADDYICKPYYLQEVVARVKTVLRRLNIKTKTNELSQSIILNEDVNSMIIDGVVVKLTRVEFRLLHYLLQRIGKICKRDDLINNLYDDYRVVSDRTVDTHVKNLRKKIAEILPDKEIIRSVYGVGYIVEFVD